MPNIRKDEQYEEMYAWYQSGCSLSEVAEIYDVTRQSVYAGFKLRGFKMRPKNERYFEIVDGHKFTLINNGYLAMTTGKRMQLHRYIWEKHRGEIPPGHDIHHIDNNRLNNNLNNLEIYTKSEHTRMFHTPTKNKRICGCQKKADIIQITLYGEVPYCLNCYDDMTREKEVSA